jgi:peptide/nickel transport system substrate-binding protein
VTLGCTRAAPPRDALTLLSLAEPEHLDPRFPEDALGASLGRLVYRGLMQGDPRTFLPRPDLAEGMAWRDATHLRATLRADATFHDGTAVRASDVVATYRSLLDPTRGSRLRSTYARVLRAVEPVDERTVEFALLRPDGTFESLLQQPILPARDADGPELRAVAEGASRFVGAGPLRVRSLARARWEFSAAQPSAGGPSRVRVISLHDPNTLAQRMLHGDGDIAEIKPELFDVFERDARFEVSSAPSAGFTYLGIHCATATLADRRVRAALAHAIDRERLREGKLGRHAVRATGPIPPSHWAYAGDVPTYAFDPARARQLLDEAGLVDPPGPAPRVRWVMRVSSQRFATTVAHAMASMLADVGVEVDVRPSELATLFSDLRGGRFDLTFLTVPDLSDPWGLAFWFASTSIPTTASPNAGGNRWRFRDATLDEALEAGARAIGPDARRPHYQRAQRILARELPVIPLWHADVVYAMSRRYEGLAPRGDGQLDFLLRLRRRPGM